MKQDLVNAPEIRRKLAEIDEQLHNIKEYKSSNTKQSRLLREKDKELNTVKSELEKKKNILENALKLSGGI